MSGVRTARARGWALAARGVIGAGLSLALSLGGSSKASAGPQQGDSEGRLVKDMVRDAVTLEKAGKCKDALALLRQAAAIRETAEVLLNVGECQAQSGSLLEALKTWENAVDVARNEKDKATQQVLTQKVADLRSRVPTISLRMPRDVTRPQVKIDDQPQAIDRVAAPILVNPGEHTLSVSAEGRLPFTKKLKLVERDGAVINVVLPNVGEAAPVDEQPVEPAKQPFLPLGTWVAAGATVVLAGGGVASFFAAGSAASDGKAQCAKEVTCSPSQKSQVHTLDTLALGLWVGAGASAAFGVTWWAMNRPKGAAPPPAQVGFSVTPSGASLHGTF